MGEKGSDSETTASTSLVQDEVDTAIGNLIQDLEDDTDQDEAPAKRCKIEVVSTEDEQPARNTRATRSNDDSLIVLKPDLESEELMISDDRNAKLPLYVMDFLNFKEKLTLKKAVPKVHPGVRNSTSKRKIALGGINLGKEIYKSSVLDYDGDPATSCMTCKVTFVNARWLERHKNHFHKNCSECPVCTLLIQDQVMDVHMAGHNKVVEESVVVSMNGKIVNKGPKKDIEFTCRECNKSFESEEHLSYHRLVHQNKIMIVQKEKCPHCGAEFYEADMLRNHLKIHSSRRVHSCIYCNKHFFVLAEKVCHERIHTGVKPYVCEDCGKAFRKQFSLTMHRRHVHLNDRRYQCDIDDCRQKFVTLASLSVHKQRHDKTPRFKCKLCPKLFSNTGTRANHQRRKHYGAIEYVCKICTRIFNSMSTLRVHYNKHESMELKYTCHMCPQAYGRSLFLGKHLKEVHEVSLVEVTD